MSNYTVGVNLPRLSSARGALANRHPLWTRLPLAVLGGVCLGSMYAPHTIGWAAPLPVAVLVLTLRGLRLRAAALTGFGFGLGFYAMLLPWVAVIGQDAMIALVVLASLYFGLLGAAAALLLRSRWWVATVPAAWVGQELLAASFPFGGFPWGRLAWTATESPLLRLASLIGVSGTSYVVALLGCLIAYASCRAPSAARTRRWAAAVSAVAVFLATLAIPLPQARGRAVPVAIIQGDVPGKGMNFLGEKRTVTRNHVATTQALAEAIAKGQAPKPELVLWPENSTDIDPIKDTLTNADIWRAVRAIGVPILVGAVFSGPTEGYRQTAGLVWDPVTGPGEYYLKQHPVPFGEYIPMRNLLLPFIDRLKIVGDQTMPGHRPGNLTVNGVTYGDVICFEVAYDGIVNRTVNAGTQILVVQTNNADYTDTDQPLQQFAITRFRAVESGRTTVVASTNGISGVIQADGHETWRSQEHTRVAYMTDARMSDHRTVAMRLGFGLDYLIGAGALLALGIALIERKRRAKAAGTGPTAASTDLNQTADTDVASMDRTREKERV